VRANLEHAVLAEEEGWLGHHRGLGGDTWLHLLVVTYLDV
jgi:hypothetical protein